MTNMINWTEDDLIYKDAAAAVLSTVVSSIPAVVSNNSDNYPRPSDSLD